MFPKFLKFLIVVAIDLRPFEIASVVLTFDTFLSFVKRNKGIEKIIW